MTKIQNGGPLCVQLGTFDIRICFLTGCCAIGFRYLIAKHPVRILEFESPCFALDTRRIRLYPHARQAIYPGKDASEELLISFKNHAPVHSTSF